jgi:acetamidase/formamidase
MERVSLTFGLRAGMDLQWPRANTAAGWITLGFDRDLNEAMFIALGEMVDLMSARLGIGRADALNLASLVADLRVTQVVNQVWGAHAVLPHEKLSALLGRAD